MLQQYHQVSERMAKSIKAVGANKLNKKTNNHNHKAGKSSATTTTTTTTSTNKKPKSGGGVLLSNASVETTTTTSSNNSTTSSQDLALLLEGDEDISESQVSCNSHSNSHSQTSSSIASSHHPVGCSTSTPKEKIASTTVTRDQLEQQRRRVWEQRIRTKWIVGELDPRLEWLTQRRDELQAILKCHVDRAQIRSACHNETGAQISLRRVTSTQATLASLDQAQTWLQSERDQFQQALLQQESASSLELQDLLANGIQDSCLTKVDAILDAASCSGSGSSEATMPWKQNPKNQTNGSVVGGGAAATKKSPSLTTTQSS
ncbi:hypothetical protein ACA910_003342 [Epithemia clementina (nom. ined.)]